MLSFHSIFPTHLRLRYNSQLLRLRTPCFVQEVWQHNSWHDDFLLSETLLGGALNVASSTSSALHIVLRYVAFSNIHDKHLVRQHWPKSTFEYGVSMNGVLNNAGIRYEIIHFRFYRIKQRFVITPFRQSFNDPMKIRIESDDSPWLWKNQRVEKRLIGW